MSEHLYTSPTIDRSLSLRRHIMTTAMRSFGGWGYREIQVPLLHFFEALRPGLDEDQIERSFRFVDRGGNLMMLRPDVTPVIAQIFALQYGHGVGLSIWEKPSSVRLSLSRRWAHCTCSDSGEILIFFRRG